MPAATPKVKIFLSIESEYSQLEEEINRWLEKTKPSRVISIQANIAPQSPSSSQGLGSFGSSDLFVVVLYEPS